MSEAVMIITGESSGELYGSLLAKAIMTLWPEVKVFGVGGERMKEAGVTVFAEISSAFGLLEALSSLKKVKDAYDMTLHMMSDVSPRVIVLIDYPDFNFRVAKAAKKMGIRVLYYVSPQVWAWRRGRVKTIGEIAERIAVILPFEEEIYKAKGIPCEFVGHPILEEIDALSAIDARKTLGIIEGAPLISILPGSRPHEFNSLLPVLLELVRDFKKDFPDYRFILPLAPNIDSTKYGGYLSGLQKQGVLIIKGNAILALSASDMAVIASGTAALQAAFLQRPMVVIYKVSPLSYFLGKLIIKVKHISLVNILLGRTVVPELIQARANAGDIMTELKRLMSDSAYRDEMLSAFRAIKDLYKGKKPSLRVAQMIAEMAGYEGSMTPTEKGSMTP